MPSEQSTKKYKSQAHCCNADQPCEKVRPTVHYNDIRAFVAHPFSPDKIEWVQELKEKLSPYIAVTLPEQRKGTGVLFCKICQEIRSNTCIVSELTELNRNVIFEHGFAIATGARAVALVDRTKRITSQLDVLTDIERFEYANIEEVVEHILELGTQGQLDRVYGSTGYPKLLGEWDISSSSTDYTKLCFLRTQPDVTDNLKRISKTMRSSKFKNIDFVDPDEYATHRLLEYCNRIRESFAVVGNFVSDTTKDHERLNALTALLLGISVGLGKRILVLQELPIDKQMIDLGNVVKSYATRSELESKLSACLDQWYDMSQRESTEKKKSEKEETSRRAVLELGASAAECDDLLIKAYYDTSYTEYATKGSRFLIVGSKGSGKSAIYKYLLNSEDPGGRIKRLFYEFTDVEVQRLLELAEAWDGNVNSELLFRCFWRFNFILDITDSLLEDYDLANLYEEDRANLYRWRKDLEIGENEDYVGRFLKFIRGDLGSAPKKSNILKSRLNDGEAILQSVLVSYKVYVYADQLDVGWDSTNLQCRTLVRSFVHECFMLKSSMPDQMYPVLFLRADIIDHLKEGLQESDKWDIAYIRWTRLQIRELLERRLMASQGIDDEAIDWSVVVKDEINNQTGIEYLLDRTYLRPRDAIQLMQIVIQHALGDSGLPARKESILRALSLFAKDRLLNLSLERQATHPHLRSIVEDTLNLFHDGKPARREIYEAELVKLGQNRGIEWLVEDPIRMMYEAGVIVLEDDLESLLWVEDINYDRAIMLAKKRKEYAIVPRFRWFRNALKKKQESSYNNVLLHPALHGLLGSLSDKVIFRGRS